MVKRFFISCLFLTFIFINLYTTICYATSVIVTHENLSTAFQKFVSSEANEDNCKISVSNNVVNIVADGESYSLNYDLTDKPTFSLEIPIEKGMSYDDFQKQTDNLILPMLGYIAVANVQGVEIEDASAYFLFSCLGSSLDGSFSTEDSYIIVDDLNVSEGVTIEKTDNPNTIYTSEFGERVMEYVNSIYKDKQSITDFTEINSYLFTIEKQDTTDMSCKLVSTLSVNLDADFSKLNGYSNQIGDSFMDSDITKENADYTITLKVGQKCNIETNAKITSYQLSGHDCIEINKDCTEIIATKVGVQNGYIHIGDIKKSIYITVEENTENETLDTIILKIDEVSDDDIMPDKNVEEKEENTHLKDNTVVPSYELPQTGFNNIVLTIIVMFIVLIIVIGVKIKKYRYIK